MTFQIHALLAEDFAPLFQLSDTDLHTRRARRMTVTESPGTPCRVTLADAEVGETVILVNHTHLDVDTPYRAAHAIFIRQGQPQAHPAPGEIPAAFRSRIMSLRVLDAEGMMIDATALPGTEIGPALNRFLTVPGVEQVHLHFAGPGCFAARATLATTSP